MYGIYKVNPNDTLDIIAEKYGTTSSTLIEINGLSVTTPLPEEIIVPISQNQTYQYYTVKKGDNVYSISQKYNINYDLLLKINGLDKDDYIYPNQTIIIPQQPKNIYLTKEGDTIHSIADTFNTTISKILEKNNEIYLLPEQIIILQEK